MTNQFVDHQGRIVKIGKELGRGGEGAVFEIAGTHEYVAKLYLKPAELEKAEKLWLMVGLSPETLRKFAAWPVATLHSQMRGPTLGIVMPRIAAPTEIHELYSPAHRKQVFPTADWRFLIRAAANCAAAFQTLHEKQIVVGDVNQGNILVSSEATVNLIDCDSFQIAGNGRIYKCNVGVPHFTPPELPGFHEVRTENHDNFGLAVMIFHLLFMGRHPYSGRFGGRGDMPLEKAIKEHRFAFGRDASRFQMAPPPNSLKLTDIPTEIGALFEQSFADPRLNRPRPTATQWGQSLIRMESLLQRCSRDAGHMYVQGTSCPWCRIVHESGPNFFISVTFRAAESRASTFSLPKLWIEIQAIRSPGEALPPFRPPAAQALTARPIRIDLDTTQSARFLLASIAGGAVLLSLLAFVLPILAAFTIPIAVIFSIWWAILWMMRPFNKELRRRKGEFARLRHELERAKIGRGAALRHHEKAFAAMQSQLLDARGKYERIAQERDDELKSLHASARDRQLDDFLESRFISNANIKGIRAARISVLESYGIETAADISYERVIMVPGFGPALSSELVAWKNVQISMFRFDPQKGVPAAAVQALELKCFQRRTQLQAILEAGPQNLRRINDTAKAELGRLDEQISRLELQAQQALADASIRV